MLAEIVATITDGGELTAAEHRDLLDNILTSMVNIGDDIVPGAHSALRAYNAGDMVVHEDRLLHCWADITAHAFVATEWDDVDRLQHIHAITDTATANIDLDAGGTKNSRRVRNIICGGATQTVTTITNGVSGRVYTFIPEAGKTITLTHTGIGAVAADQMVMKGGGNLVLVGRTGEASDWATFQLDSVSGFWIEIDSAIYP